MDDKISHIVVDVICRICNRKIEVAADRNGYLAWQGGRPIAIALPSLGKDESNLLDLKICAVCLFNYNRSLTK